MLTAWAAAPSAAAPPDRDSGGHGHCARQDILRVPGADRQQADCLAELTTAGTVASGHTDPADWAGLTPEGLATPSGVPGIQIDGHFPDTSTGNTNHGWNHDSQFVIRLPDRWNGGLVVAGSPGVREQYANDRAFGDWALARGYAFAATDKGNTSAAFHRDGRTPGDAIAEWNTRFTQLTRAARLVVAQRYLRPPSRTLAMGMSNGGYLVRWQLENHPGLYDGGVDWEGALWRADGPHLLTFLPPALRAYPRYAAGGADAEEAHRTMTAAGYPAGSEFLWPYHHQYYWDLTQRIYREELDPGFDGATEAGTPFSRPRDPRLRRRLRVRGAAGRGPRRGREDRADRPYREAADQLPRHPGRAAPDFPDLGHVRADGAEGGPGRAAPLLPRRGRYACGLARRHLPRAAASAGAVPPFGGRGAGTLAGRRAASPVEPHPEAAREGHARRAARPLPARRVAGRPAGRVADWVAGRVAKSTTSFPPTVEIHAMGCPAGRL
ncbi:Tannase and feruloyl esterase [Streptomyces sp. Ncost-T6T-2b]|nr:Tannase and feruloyl esterase [Streptomyces sp. Ncost-T6T-2b]